MNDLMKRVLSTEYLFAALFIAIFFITVGNFEWYWLFILFLAFDISALGYLISRRIGAFFYNIGHSIIGPTFLASIYILTTNQAILFVCLIWLFHIFVDRAFGYGLKHTSGFQDTHLGTIGKQK